MKLLKTLLVTILLLVAWGLSFMGGVWTGYWEAKAQTNYLPNVRWSVVSTMNDIPYIEQAYIFLESPQLNCTVIVTKDSYKKELRAVVLANHEDFRSVPY